MTITTKYKTYSKYKPTGIDWLGDIPDSWEVKKAKFLSDFVSGYSFDSESYVDDGVPIIRIGDIAEIIDFESVKKVPIDLSIGLEKFNVKSGDILLALTGATIGKTAIYNSTEVALLNQRVAILRGKKLDQKYLTYFIASSIFKENIDYLCFGGAQENIGKSEIGSIIISYPKCDEQKEIATFLDHETAKIDEVVTKKQRMIDLLKEKRQALITHAVTKGLDPKAKMKPSGIDWLGEIPEGWNALPLKRVVGIKITDGPHETPEILDEGVNFISAEAVKNEKINFDLRRGFISEELYELYSKKCKPQKNDIFLIKSGATTGNIAIVEVDFEFSIWSPLALIRADEKRSKYRFLFYSLLSKLFHDQVEFSWSYGTQQNIGMGVIENLIITLPPYALQKDIADYIDLETAKIDEMVKKVEMQIEKLQEYRQAIITNAVTGKIKID